MNDKNPQTPGHVYIQMSNSGGGGGVEDVEKLLEDVEVIRDELRVFEALCSNLRSAHEQMQSNTNFPNYANAKSRLDKHVGAALTKASLIKVRLEALDHSYADAAAIRRPIFFFIVGGTLSAMLVILMQAWGAW